MANRQFNWPLLTSVFTKSDLMDAVMHKIGIRAAMAARRNRGSAILDARTTCLQCHQDARCRQWLASSQAL